VTEFDDAMDVLAAGGSTDDYRCEEQVDARIGACGDCAPGSWGPACAVCPMSDMGIPCDGYGTCSDGTAGDGTCTCDQGYELDLENGTCRVEDICYPDPCTGTNETAGSCMSLMGQDEQMTYSCSCENGANWDYTDKVCFSWCEPNPCLADPNSNGTCYSMSLEYYCGCVENYFFDAGQKLCVPSNQ